MLRKQTSDIVPPPVDHAAEWLSAFAALERPTAAISRLASSLPTDPASVLRIAERLGLAPFDPSAQQAFAERGRALFEEQTELVAAMGRLATVISRAVGAAGERGHPEVIAFRSLPADCLGRSLSPSGPVQLVFPDRLEEEHPLVESVQGWTLPVVDGEPAVVLGRLWGGAPSPWYYLPESRRLTEGLAARQQADRDAERDRLERQRRESEEFARRRAEAFAASPAGVAAELAQMRAQLAQVAELAGASR